MHCQNIKFGLLLLLFIFILPAATHVTLLYSITKNEKTISAVRVKGDSLFIQNKYNDKEDIQICFTKCMFNQLMTFWNVGLVKNEDKLPILECPPSVHTEINKSVSDNIGPVSVSQLHSWFGGNHSYQENQNNCTAFTESYEFSADGKTLNDGDNLFAQQVKVRVRNRLYDPASKIINGNNEITGFSGTMCLETVEYTIQEGNIEVNLTHEWQNKTPYCISVYYGMQSMAQGEEIFFPHGHTSDFIIKEDRVSRNKEDYPLHDRFIQKGAAGQWYESCYLKPLGTGSHKSIKPSDFIYLINYGKVYHRQLTNKKVRKGTRYHWTGIYSYVQPIIDNEKIIAYIIKDSTGYILIADMKEKGSYTVTIPSYINTLKKKIVYRDKGIIPDLKSINDSVSIQADNKGSCYIGFESR